MIGEYVIDSFQSLQQTSDNVFGVDFGAMSNFIVELFYTGLRFLYGVFDQILKGLSTMSIIEEQSSLVFNIANELHRFLYGSFGVVFVGITLTFIFFHALLNYRVRSQVLSLLFVFMLNTALFTAGPKVLTIVNQLAASIETQVAQIVTQLPIEPLDVSSGEDEAEAVRTENKLVNPIASRRLPKTDEEQKEDVQEMATEALRKLMYTEMITRPFALLNFGEYEFNEEKMSPFLISSTVTDSKDLEDRRGKITEEVNKTTDNPYFTSQKGTEKIFMSIFILFNGIFVGGVLIFVTIVRVLLEVLILAVILLLPIISVLSLLPWFSHSLAKGISKILSLFGLMIFITVVSSVLFFFLNVIDRAGITVMGVSSFTYFANFILKCIFLIIVYRYQTQLVTLVTGGMIRSKVTIRRSQTLDKIARKSDSFARDTKNKVKGWWKKQTATTGEGTMSTYTGVDSEQYSSVGSGYQSPKKTTTSSQRSATHDTTGTSSGDEGKRFSVKIKRFWLKPEKKGTVGEDSYASVPRNEHRNRVNPQQQTKRVTDSKEEKTESTTRMNRMASTKKATDSKKHPFPKNQKMTLSKDLKQRKQELKRLLEVYREQKQG